MSTKPEHVLYFQVRRANPHIRATRAMEYARDLVRSHGGHIAGMLTI